jgi:Autochaperone Domain Type 1
VSLTNHNLITGYIMLDGGDDVAQNLLDSNFGAGNDRFTNTDSGIVRTAHNGGATEITRFNGLENFYNSGLVTLIDGGEGDRFFLSGDFHAGSGVLGVDAFLGPPGSIADVMQIENDVTGETALRVNNTSPFGGALNKQGITVVEVLGNATAGNFYLENGPIDAGFFVYELFFEPGAVNIFELRSGAPGSSAFILVTTSQDIWHATAGTWFDRAADLRVLLNGGGPGMAGGGYGMQPMRAAPAIDSVGYSAFGRSRRCGPRAWVPGSTATAAPRVLGRCRRLLRRRQSHRLRRRGQCQRQARPACRVVAGDLLGITMEPFVIGSVWSNLSGDNEASLTSFGTPFLFEDDIPDVWGEASLGVNFVAPGALTAL